MNHTMHAIRVGLARGWTEVLFSLRSPQDQGFYVTVGLVAVGTMYLQRDTVVDGTSLLLPSIAMPSVLGGLVAFGVIMGPAFALTMEREDGTLLRARVAPDGMAGYVTGQLLLHSVGLIPLLAVVLIPSMFLFDDLMHNGVVGWLTALWVFGLGLLATTPIGLVIGALAPSVQKVGSWGMLSIGLLAGISGILFPMQSLWGWVQTIAQVFPLYWIGLGMRSAFLPDAVAAIEITGSWRTTETVLVLVAWAVVGAMVVPSVLRRMAQRQSGAAVQQARATAAQYVR